MRKLFLLVTAVLVSIVASPLVAQAHTSKPTLMIPEENSEIEVMPDELVLGFSENLIQSGAAVSILDPSGEQLVDVLPTVEDRNLSVKVNPSVYKGEYRITYKVTSADGAINQGTYRVYTTSGEDFDPNAAQANETAPVTSSDSSTASAKEVVNSENYNYILLIGGALAVLFGAFLYYRADGRGAEQ